MKKPWIDEFPELAKMLKLNPFAQTFCRVELNYVNGVREPFHIHGGDGTVEGMENRDKGQFKDLPREGRFFLPEEIPLEAFVDVPSLDFAFRDGFQPTPGFQPIPFGEIGLVADGFRPSPPEKRVYRPAIYQPS